LNSNELGFTVASIVNPLHSYCICTVAATVTLGMLQYISRAWQRHAWRAYDWHQTGCDNQHALEANPRAPLAEIHEEIRAVMNILQGSKIQYIKQSANRVAHELAQHALKSRSV
jgi:hypothetical protein